MMNKNASNVLNRTHKINVLCSAMAKNTKNIVMRRNKYKLEVYEVFQIASMIVARYNNRNYRRRSNEIASLPTLSFQQSCNG